MGNQIHSCCSSNHSIISQEEPKTDIKQRYKTLPSPPKINEKVVQSLHKSKPFESQFNNQQSMVIVKSEDDIVYHGVVDSNNLPHGYGKIYQENGTLMIGRFEHGTRIGQHFLFLPEGSYYKGIIENGQITEGQYNGQESFNYIGQFRNYQLHGKGTQIHKDYRYQGEYQMGKRVKGTLKWQQNNFVNLYQGTFDQNELFDGIGQLITRQGTYKGQFKKGSKQGQGRFQFTNGLTYQGQYLNGQRNGLGKIINSNGTISYQGEFLNGLPHGKGKSLKENGKVKEGEFQYGIASHHYARLMQCRALKDQINR